MSSNKTTLRERFTKLWERIEATRKGHISGRSIWNADTEDPEGDSYRFADDSLFSFIESEIAASEERVRGKKAIKLMVDLFLGWRLPDDFSPDGGISFEKIITMPIGPIFA